MANEPTTASAAGSPLPAWRVYGMAGLCLVVGLAIGYLLQGSKSNLSPAQPAAKAATPSASGAMPSMPGPPESSQTAANPAPVASAAAPASPHMAGGHQPTLAELHQIADKQAAPLLEKLKSEPNNTAALAQIAAIYHTTHRFQEAAAYYDRAVEVEPKNLRLRTKLASSLYRSGDADGAIAQLNRALKIDPSDADALFDLGLILLQGKQDATGALAAWRQLLKSNPQLAPEREATVQRLIAQVLTTLSDQHGIEGARSNDGHK